ncbi:uncharacterized protein TNIN_332141 [Trichonephila inaurata madagascariensis]|uniref:Uncharacterized protein n=1 Tax=Trichonephila inaurata madagascariensis TaxID=2747483 RepID=A0A8X6XHS7_9ARAC|nr:uncharacterized protein TNIN_408071 [Trichonephila inaurata madagascariensis]GFY69002.1 uncharacterized protein TNIN_332141 [Trichonephila inaurata madagascariensis]
MASLPRPCHPHYCQFDSPACPEQCKCSCNKVKPDCVSITAQEALNIPELKFKRTKRGVPLEGISTRERIFGIPYDPRKDFAIQVPPHEVDRYLKQNYQTMESRVLKEYVVNSCCSGECHCIMGPNCRCRSSN